MMKLVQRGLRNNSFVSATGLTLVEVVVSLCISSLAVSAIVSGYVFGINSTQKSALYLTASARALERLEDTRAAKWDTSCWPAVDQLVNSNFPVQVVLLDQSGKGTGIVFATNYTRITQSSVNPPIKSIHVDCVWSFNQNQLITNAIEACRAPDQ